MKHMYISKFVREQITRGLDMSKWQDILKFWMRMSTKLSNMSKNKEIRQAGAEVVPGSNSVKVR